MTRTHAVSSLYDPSRIRTWFLDKQRPKDLDLIHSAHQTVIVRETEKALQIQWLSEAGEILFDSWAPKSAVELKAQAMVCIAGEDALKTELREWMWERGLLSDGTETISELQNVVLWNKYWQKLPKHLQRAHVQPYDPMGKCS